jgi:predicted MFS family arabinose efflux permease
VGALAAELKAAFGVGNTAIGLLVTVSVGVGALATLPFRVLIDRVNRTRLLSVVVLIWCVAMLVSGAAVSHPMLLLSRLALSAVVAAASPAVASLIGDLFPATERSRTPRTFDPPPQRPVGQIAGGANNGEEPAWCALTK